MKEFKVVKTTLVGKPKLALVVGAYIVAEPDAKRGMWCNNLDDIFIICNTPDEAFELIRSINFSQDGVFKTNFKVDERIINYLTNKSV
jgi:hypothetical protein